MENIGKTLSDINRTNLLYQSFITLPCRVIKINKGDLINLKGFCTAKKTALTKEARIHNGLKTISLTSGAGKTGQPLVKE